MLACMKKWDAFIAHMFCCILSGSSDENTTHLFYELLAQKLCLSRHPYAFRDLVQSFQNPLLVSIKASCLHKLSEKALHKFSVVFRSQLSHRSPFPCSTF